jgi:hypothetical protein
MINRIRVATKEEIAAIADVSDLGPTCTVLALDTPEGAMKAVIRTAIEIDPVIYPEPDKLSMRMRAMFWRDLETVLAAQGATKYYFNVHVTNKAMCDTVKTWGAFQLSTEPEFRFSKVL